MRKLRSIVLGCGLGEELKWYKPVYTFGEKNVVIIMAMKETVALAFCKGALLKDPKHVLARIAENSQAGRWIKFTSVREITALATTLKAYIREAVEAEKAGLQVPAKKTSDYPVPEELKKKLAALPAFKKAFTALTPGRQRGYLIYFAGAKQSKTRESRIAKCMPLIFPVMRERRGPEGTVTVQGTIPVITGKLKAKKRITEEESAFLSTHANAPFKITLPSPVSDVDKAKQFYSRLGWRLDADFSPDGAFRVVQFTPPGSPCSVQFGTGMTQAAPGSSHGNYLVVADVAAARADLVAHGIAVSEVFHAGTPGAQFKYDGRTGRILGPAPDRTSYGSYATFDDPDGNGWILQEVTVRLPGRMDSNQTVYASASDLASAMQRASVAHGEHEERIGKADPDWPDWYATYMFAEQAGSPLPS